MAIRYALAERALAQLYGAADQKPALSKLRSRLKHFRKRGLPRAGKIGTGFVLHYDDRTIFELAVALEMAEVGTDPQSIVALIEQHFDEDIWPKLGALWEAGTLGDGVGMTDDLLAIVPTVMSAKSWPTRKKQPIFSVTWETQESVGRWAGRLGGLRRRGVLINASALLREFGPAWARASSTKPSGRKSS
jgi:hypothetical protein